MDKRDLLIAAELAQIDLDQNSLEKLRYALVEMLDCFEKITSFNVQGVDSALSPQTSYVRLDEPRESVLAFDIVKRAPLLEERFFVVPNVL